MTSWFGRGASGAAPGRAAASGPMARDNLRGAAWMLASAATFSVAVSLIKFLGADYSAAMQSFIRQIVCVIVLLPFIARDPRGAFATSHFRLFVARGLTTSLSMVLGYASYQQMPLAEANALSFTRTLWLVPLAVIFLKERVGAARIVATAIGFLGVLIVLRPDSAENYLGLPALWGVLAAMLMAVSVTGIKALSRSHGMVALLSWAAVLGTLFTAPAALLDWSAPSPRDWGWLVAMGLASVVSQVCYIRGLSLGDATLLAPLDYSRIVTTAILALVVFGEVPDWTTWVGAAVIVCPAVFITLRERRPAPAPDVAAS